MVLGQGNTREPGCFSVSRAHHCQLKHTTSQSVLFPRLTGSYPPREPIKVEPKARPLVAPSMSEATPDRSEGIVAWCELHADPSQLSEFLQSSLAAEAAPTAILYAAKRHLRLVMNRLIVYVNYP